MANALYAKGKQKLLSGSINIPSDVIRVALVSTAYTEQLALDEFYNGLSFAVLGTPQTLAGKTVTDGVFDANDVTFATVAAGSTAKALVIYKDTGLPSTSPLIAFIDTITGFPLATNGGDISIVWDAGTNRIFAL
jgi:hypothetical protein